MLTECRLAAMALVLGTRLRGFESRRSDRRLVQWQEYCFYTAGIVGSNPTTSTNEVKFQQRSLGLLPLLRNTG